MVVLRALTFVLLYAYHLLTFPLLAGGLLVWGMDATGLLDAGTGWLIALSPLVYLTWLTLTLSLYSLQMQNVKLVGWKKPRRCSSADAAGSRQSALVGAVMLRTIMIWSLPVSRYFLRLPLLNRLVLYSIATETHIGKDAQIWGYLYDPDLTTIGDHAIIGGGAAISAHSLTTRVDGSFTYVSAPIEIGDRAVIGGEARIGLGARIGADAVVEAGSVVAPFTEIGQGEIWSGNPARFERHRFATRDETADDSTDPGVSILSAEDEAALKKLVAESLDLPIEEITDQFRTADTDRWDSLAQLGIAAAIHDRFGINLTSDEVFSALSLAQLREPIAVSSATVGQVSNLSYGTAAPPLNPELLPLLNHADATRLLSDRATSGELSDKATVRIAATFTADPVISTVRTWCAGFSIDADVGIAGYDQVEQTLLDPQSPFHTDENGIRVVLTRPEDLLTTDGQSRTERLLEAIESFGKTTGRTLLVGTLPPVVSSFSSVSREQVVEAQSLWQSTLQKRDLVELLDFAGVIERVGIQSAAQPDMDVVARCPYSPAVFQELGIELARHVRKRFRPAAKVLALDADNTLWGGIVGEDGLDGLQLSDDHPGRSFRLFQQSIRVLKDRGVMLVLVSRNDEADVLQVLDEHPGMVLKREDFVATRINWAAKSQNLKELAEELNVGLDSFVFVDDDPANRAEVTANAPEVLVFPLPDDPVRYTETLTRLWCFDGLRGTTEDQSRTKMMRQQTERDQLRTRSADPQDWLQSLELRAEMRPAHDRDLPRVAQLVQKTNQFNLSLRRRTLDEIRTLSRQADIFVISAADRFGDYGLIGVAIVQSDDANRLVLDTFLLSCRALGRGIEHAALHELVQLRRREGLSTIIAPFEVGPRNTPVREFLEQTGFAPRGNIYEAPASIACSVASSLDWIGPCDSRAKDKVA